MLKEITTYPTTPSLEFGANVCHFDASLFELIRLDEDERKVFDAKLEFGTDAIMQNDCPTVFKRDRILQILKTDTNISTHQRIPYYWTLLYMVNETDKNM